MDNKSLPRPPIELLELATGYQRSKTLFVMLEFRLPTLLEQRPLSLAEIAKDLNIHLLAADRFLNACVALGLIERVDGEYRNTRLSEQFLVQGKSTYLGGQFARYDQPSYQNWSELTNKLRAWQPGDTDNQTPEEADQGASAMRDQHNLALMIGYALGEAYEFASHHVMLDLGAGTGAMSIGICGVHRKLQSILFDLPEVAAVANEYIQSAGLSERIEIASGNFKEDQLPSGFDVALLANLLSVASEETNRQLFKRIYNQLPENGAIILSGWILDDQRTSPLIPVLFCLEDINWQAPDVERSASTYKKWLEEAGFVDIEHESYCTPTSMIVGRKIKI